MMEEKDVTLLAINVFMTLVTAILQVATNDVQYRVVKDRRIVA